jgi:hypothetical protein
VEFLRGGALWTLAETGDASRPYLDRARALLKEKSAVTRVCAAYLLASRKASMPAAMKVLEEVLRSGDRRGIQEACRAAARLGPTAKPLEKALRDLRSKGKLDAEQKEDVQEALDAIG